MSKLTLEQALEILDTFMQNDLTRRCDAISVCWESMKIVAAAIHNGRKISDKELLTAFGAATRLEQSATSFYTEANEMLVALETVREARQAGEENEMKLRNHFGGIGW
jgi:hypothetical protein